MQYHVSRVSSSINNENECQDVDHEVCSEMCVIISTLSMYSARAGFDLQILFTSSSGFQNSLRQPSSCLHHLFFNSPSPYSFNNFSVWTNFSLCCVAFFSNLIVVDWASFCLYLSLIAICPVLSLLSHPLWFVVALSLLACFIPSL